jgi:hypothetical protein
LRRPNPDEQVVQMTLDEQISQSEGHESQVCKAMFGKVVFGHETMQVDPLRKASLGPEVTQEEQLVAAS